MILAAASQKETFLNGRGQFLQHKSLTNRFSTMSLCEYFIYNRAGAMIVNVLTKFKMLQKYRRSR